MKNVIIALSTAALLSLSTSIFADGNATVIVIDSGITQIQTDDNQEQDAIIGSVGREFNGDATILVSGSTILQAQGGNVNKQKARIAVVGSCDC